MCCFCAGIRPGTCAFPPGVSCGHSPDGKGDIYRYVTDELAVLPEGAASVAVPATAEEYGQGANAAVGQICELVTPVEGIAGVTNEAGWLLEEGADAESDASLRRRYVLAWQSQAGVTRAAYEAAALPFPVWWTCMWRISIRAGKARWTWWYRARRVCLRQACCRTCAPL